MGRILAAVRQHLGLEIAFASRFVEGRREFTHLDADIALPVQVGYSEPLEDTLCQRILDGQLPALMHDASEFAAARAVPITAALPIGSHMNVPLRMRDGRVYGTFCCISRQPDRSLTARDLDTLRAFADIAAGQIERKLDREQEQDAGHRRIDAAVAGNGFVIHHQPIHRLADGKPVGVECLSRFPGDPTRSPGDWFEEAAILGRGAELELLAVERALASLPYVPDGMYMAINIAPEIVATGVLEALLAKVPSGRVVVEVTEHHQVADYPDLVRALDRLRGMARIAIDDVGAGYSGLRHIVDLRPDIIKLDMSLTRDVDRDPARSALTHAMVAFARGIGCSIVAEGVQTAGERDALLAAGVGHGQGYHFSRPMPPVSAQQLLLGCATTSPPEPVRSIARRPRARLA